MCCQVRPTLRSFTTMLAALCGRTGREPTASSCSGPRWNPVLWTGSWPTDWASDRRVCRATRDRARGRFLNFLCLRQVGQSRWWEQQIPIEGTIQKGELLTYNLTELLKPESYLVRLTPITRFGEGDTAERIISYSSTFVSDSS